MTDMNPREAFIRFILNHNYFTDIGFAYEPIKDQKIVAVIDRSFSFQANDGVVINPDYDQIIDGFMNLTYDRWAVNYFYSAIEQAKKSDKKEKFLAEAMRDLIFKPLINNNIDAQKVYFIIGDPVNWPDLSWAHEVIEV